MGQVYGPVPLGLVRTLAFLPGLSAAVGYWSEFRRSDAKASALR